jgi:hypothetical protein
MAGRNRLACFGAREKGTCRNRLTIRSDEVEARVLKALQDKLLNQELFEEFCDEFAREMNRLQMQHRASLSVPEREIERIEARRKKLIEMVMERVAPSVVKDELSANAARREQLEAKLAATEEPPPLLHPEMARIYRSKVTELVKALRSQTAGRSHRATRPRGRHRAHARPGRRDPSNRIEGEFGGHARGHRTSEEVVGIRRPLLASIFGCGGVQPAVLAAVERGDVIAAAYARQCEGFV